MLKAKPFVSSIATFATAVVTLTLPYVFPESLSKHSAWLLTFGILLLLLSGAMALADRLKGGLRPQDFPTDSEPGMSNGPKKKVMIQYGPGARNNRVYNIKTYGLEWDGVVEDHGTGNVTSHVEAHRGPPPERQREPERRPKRYYPGVRFEKPDESDKD
jgi:hypothetical protein